MKSIRMAAWTVGIVAAGGVLVHFAGARVHTYAVAPEASLPRWPWSKGGVLYQSPQRQVVPYTTVRTTDPNVPSGQTLVTAPGQLGLAYEVDGVRTLVQPTRSARVVVGIAPTHQLHVAGATYQYDRVLSMMTTAYNGSIAMNGSAGAVAAWNGEPLHQGDVAVDPTVIPFGTYLYVDGYGLARAVDSGSDIVGNHIDLFFNESSQAVSNYGIRYEKVYELGPIKPTGQ